MALTSGGRTLIYHVNDPNRFPNLKTMTVLAVSCSSSDLYKQRKIYNHDPRDCDQDSPYLCNPVSDLADDSGLDENGELNNKEYVRLETVACLWARRPPGFEVVFNTAPSMGGDDDDSTSNSST